MRDYYRGWRSGNHHSNTFASRPKVRRSGGRLLWKFLAFIFFLLVIPLRFVFSRRGVLKKLLFLVIVLGLFSFIFFGLTFAYYAFNLPDPNKLAQRIIPESTKIFDRHGKLLYEIHGEAKRTLIPLSEVPKFAKEATIAIEDKNFYKHQGISLAGIARAALVNLLSGNPFRQGGSTITQQFVRSAVLTREKTFARKFKEIALALQLERKYSKDQILQLYLNEIPYGSNAYGIQAASQTFFGKNAKDLNLTESAYLAALPKAPTYYSPFGPHKDELDARADTVLELMYEQGYITKPQRNQAQNQKVEFRNIGRGILAPHFVLYVQDLLAQKYGEISLQEGGLKVTTSLDFDLQTMAEEAVAKQAEINTQKFNASNASLVAIDPRTQEILAMVGSKDYFNEEIDGAVNVALRPRQPGSSFKPYVYATAFQKGMSPATMLLDVETNFGEFGGKEYIPQNYDGKHRGPVSIRQALQGSLNIPAVKTAILAGVEDSIQTAENLGIMTLKDRSRFGPSLVLGGAEVKLLEHAAAYGVFATGGIKHKLTPILKIEDKTGKILEESKPSQGREVLNPQLAYQITHVLSDNEARAFIFGRNSKLVLPGRPAAAKTGTTQEYRDAWTIGYTPSLVAGVWVGNNDNSPMTGGASGSLSAAGIWNEFMRRALEGKPVEQFLRPEGIEELAVDALSGKLPTAATPSTKTEVFASSFNLPKEEDNIHREGFTSLHSEKPEDPKWEEPVRAWALANGYTYPPEENFNPGGAEINLKISVPQKITALPWEVKVEVETEKAISTIQIFLDNNLLQSALGKSLVYASQTAHVDGRHLLLAQVETAENLVVSKTEVLEFALGQKLILLAPGDNQELRFPTNLLLETNQNVAEEEVKFWRRSQAGTEVEIKGSLSKRLIGQIYHYTLGWAESEKPPTGSYTIFAQIGTERSNQVVVKIP